MTLVPGTKLGPYEITSQLGSGGMGVVYRAHDSSLDRDIAIKVLPEQLAAEPDALRRFQREAKAVAALNHPNVVTIHAVEESGGVHFISMELVDGRPLGELIAKGPLPVERFLDVMTPLADALVAAHARGITHRDLKPANVMVTDDGRVKVLDFGLAKFVGTGGDLEETRLTQGGLIVGTFPYMSPEQVEGKPVDHRSDIFSLGVVMYEAVTGRRPFLGDSGPALMSAILRDAPPSASNLRADLPASVARLIDRCLEKSPGERYQGAADLRRDLRAARKEHESGATVPAATPESNAEQSIAVLPFTNMSTDPENEFFADGISEEIINTLGQIEGLRVAARGSAFSFKGKHVDPREVGQKLQVRSVLEGSVRKARKRLRITAELVNAENGYQLWSERYDRELEDVFEIQDEIARTIAARLKITLTGAAEVPLASRATDNVKAYEAYLKGRALLYKRGRFIVDALTCFEEAVQLDPNYALAWAGLADGRSTLGLFGMVAPDKTMPQAMEAATRAVQMDDSLAEAHCALALATLLHDFDVPTARREFLRSMKLDPKYPQAAAWFAMFVLAFVDGQFDEGVTLMTPIVELDPLSGYNRAVQSGLLAFGGRYDEGVAGALAAVELDPESFFPHWFLQTNYTLARRYPEAVAAGHAALAISGRHPFAMITMATTYADWGKRTEARALHDELMTRADTQWVSPCVRACTAATAGLTDDVVTLITRAIEERDPFLMLSMGTWPLTVWLRRVLREAGQLDDVRRQIGLPSND